MSNNNKSPYDDFFKDTNELDSPEQAQLSEEFLKVDRGEANLKVEKNTSLADKKNLIIAGAVVLLGIVVVGLFALKVISSFNEEENNVGVADPALERVEAESVESLRARIEAEKVKEAEAKRLAREAQAKAESDRLEREAAEAQRLAAEKARNNQPNNTNRLGRFSNSQQNQTQTAQPITIQEARHMDEKSLTAKELSILRKANGDVVFGSNNANANNNANTTDQPSTLGSMLITERHANGTAYVRPSREFLLMRGTNIACTLLPRIVTSYPSQPRCLVNEDIYSPEGVVLIERGSIAMGEQRTAMKAGVAKVFIAWADIETQEGVSINIDSMGADQLGGAGLDAWVDNHYGQRFGGAILLSFIDDFFEIIANKASKTEYNFEASSDNASSMAQIVLENTINIEPTGYVMPAQQINIIVARDVDFSHIYKVN